MDKDQLYQLIRSAEKENIRQELKSYRKLVPETSSEIKKAKDKKKDLAKLIVAFANTYGGRIIFGINDDGKFDGQWTKEYNLDDAKNIIQQICFDSVSPVVDCSFEFHELNEGDVLIVYIHKRRWIPHAIVERSTSDINTRTYYVRTSHGNKLASDAQLQWLFKSEEGPDFLYETRIVAEFDLNLGPSTIPFFGWNYFMTDFSNNLNTSQKQTLIKAQPRDSHFIIQLGPYLIFRTLLDYFTHHWNIGISAKFGRTNSGPIIKPELGTKSVRMDDGGIKIVSEYDELNEALKKLIEENFLYSQELHIPTDSHLHIDYIANYSRLSIIHPCFEFKITVSPLSYGPGLNHQTNKYHILKEENPFLPEEFRREYVFFDGVLSFEASFNFLETDIETFNQYYNYAQNIRLILDTYWNYEDKRGARPTSEFYVVKDYLNKILGKMK